MSQYRLQSQVNLPDNPKFNKSYKSDLWQEIEKIQHKIKLKKPSIKIRIIRKNKNQARERERERERGKEREREYSQFLCGKNIDWME